MRELSELDDDRLVWMIPGDLGLEVARRWREQNDRIAELEKERDALLAYAVFLQMEGTTAPDREEWTPESALGWVLRDASISAEEASRVGWSVGDMARLLICRNAVAGFRLSQE